MLKGKIWEKVYEYLKQHHLALISIVITILVFQGVKALKIGEILTPVVVFNKTPDGNKKAPTKLIGSGTLDHKNYGNEGLWVEWVKGKEGGPLNIVWELNRKNYEERHKFFLYSKVRADEKQIIAITLVDDKTLFVQDYLEVGPQTSPIAISLAQEKFDKVYKARKLDDSEKKERISELEKQQKMSESEKQKLLDKDWWESDLVEEKFHWGAIQRVELSLYDEKMIGNTIVFEKKLLLMAT